MAIWLDELEQDYAQPLRQPLRDRHLLRDTLAQRQNLTDDVLLVMDAIPRRAGPRQASTDAEAQRMLREVLARTAFELHALRAGQLCVLMPGPITNEQVKRLLMQWDRDVQAAWCRAYELVFGAARASEARDRQLNWLGLADRRFQARIAQLGLGQRLYTQARGADRRRTQRGEERRRSARR